LLTGYPGRFATTVGLNTFERNEVRAGGQDIAPGSDDSLSDSVIGVDEGDDSGDDDSLGGHPNANHFYTGHPNTDLESLIDEATEGLGNSTIKGDESMRTHSIRCENIRIRRAEDTDVNHIHLLLTELPPGMELSSIHYNVMENKRDFEVTVKQAPEMHRGVNLMPIDALWTGNSTIAAALTLAMQDHLNVTVPTDRDPHEPRPTLTASGRFSAPVERSQLNPSELYLDTNGDMYLIHQVPIEDDAGTVPAFVAIGFFLEEKQPDSTPQRRKKFDRKLPVKPKQNVSTDPNSPSKRARSSVLLLITPPLIPLRRKHLFHVSVDPMIVIMYDH